MRAPLSCITHVTILSSSFSVAPVLFSPDPSDWCPGGPFLNWQIGILLRIQTFHPSIHFATYLTVWRYSTPACLRMFYFLPSSFSTTWRDGSSSNSSGSSRLHVLTRERPQCHPSRRRVLLPLWSSEPKSAELIRIPCKSSCLRFTAATAFG